MKKRATKAEAEMGKKQRVQRDDRIAQEEEDEDERMLKNLLFGGRELSKPNQDTAAAMAAADETSSLANDALFSIDNQGDSSARAAAAAWVDSDDEEQMVNLAETNRLRKLRANEKETTVSGAEFSQRLREQHAKLAAAAAATTLESATNWAKLPSSGHAQELDEDEQRLKQASSLLAPGKRQRRPDGVDARGKITARKLDDCCAPSNCVIQALDWHEHSSNVFLTAGMDKTLRLFQLSGRKSNKLLQSVFFEDMPILAAQFADGEVILTGKRPFYYTYDVESGKLGKVQGILGRTNERSFERMANKPGLSAFALSNGYVSLVSQKSRMETAYCKSGTSVQSLSFVGEHNLMTAGSDGEIRNWDLRQLSKPIWKREDEGSQHVTALACNESMYAAGSSSGIVSVYAMDTGVKIKQVMNLTTWVGELAFNASGSVLAMASRDKQSAVRLLHLPTNQIVANFPDPNARLHKVQRVSFSKRGGILACGNDRGHVLLWKGLNL